MSEPIPMNRAERRMTLVSLDDAADYTGVCTRTIRRWIADPDQRLTGYRAGPRLIRVDLNELDAMLSPVGGAA